MHVYKIDVLTSYPVLIIWDHIPTSSAKFFFPNIIDGDRLR